MGHSMRHLAVDADIDAAIERYHDGYGDFLAGRAMAADMDRRQGWLDAQQASLVRVVMPTRPEGYFHSPLGAFE